MTNISSASGHLVSFFFSCNAILPARASKYYLNQLNQWWRILRQIKLQSENCHCKNIWICRTQNIVGNFARAWIMSSNYVHIKLWEAIVPQCPDFNCRIHPTYYWIDDYVHIKLWDAIIPQCPDFNCRIHPTYYWIDDYVHIKLWDAIIPQCPDFNCRIHPTYYLIDDYVHIKLWDAIIPQCPDFNCRIHPTYYWIDDLWLRSMSK